MKRIMILVLAGLMATPLLWAEKKAVPEQAQTERPNFIPKDKNIAKVIGKNKRIYVTEEKATRKLDKIYFSDEKGKLKKTQSIFPDNAKKKANAKIYNSPSGNYIAFDSFFAAPAKETEGDTYIHEGIQVKAKSEFKILDENGNVLWEAEADDHRSVFLTDEGIFGLGYLHKGYIELHEYTGGQVQQLIISQKTCEPGEDTDLYIEPFYAMDGDFLIIARNVFEKNEMNYYELILINLRQNEMIFKKVINSSIKADRIFSDEGQNLILIHEKGLVAYDFSGNYLWRNLFEFLPKNKRWFHFIEKVVEKGIYITLYENDKIKPRPKHAPYSKRIIKAKAVLNRVSGNIIGELKSYE